MIVLSLGSIFVLQNEIDILIQESVTENNWIYDYEERGFYINFWSSILTGGIVSLIITYVGYEQTKKRIEYKLLANIILLYAFFNDIIDGTYEDGCQKANAYLFLHDYKKAKNKHDGMMEMSYDYHIFFKTKKYIALLFAIDALYDIWRELVVKHSKVLIIHCDDEAKIVNEIKRIKSDIMPYEETIEDLCDKIDMAFSGKQKNPPQP